MVQQKKIVLVENLQDTLSENQNFALIKIDKTSHQTLENLRRELKKVGAQFKVTKNTFFEKAINKLETINKVFSELKKIFSPLKETSALLLLDKDWSKSLNSFYEFIKKEPTLSFKFGLLDGKPYKSDELLQIAQLPGKDQLVVNIVGSLKSPSNHLVFALKFNINKMVYILREKSKGR